MAANRAKSEPDGNGPNGNKETEDNSSPFTPLDTLAAIAVAAANPATAPTAGPPTRETEQNTVETVENIGDNIGGNTGEPIQPARPHASASGHRPATSAALAYLRRESILSHIVHRRSPYLPETPHHLLGQVWIDHIDSMLGVRTQTQTEEIRYCVEQTDRIVYLANNMLRQQRELLADLRRTASEEYHSDGPSSELSEVIGFFDEVEGNGNGEGDETAADGCCAANE
ncbi:unnamed protein product [Penicillium egyptiacum]|uniref:Uncharacterized protein n=1 Tax=Penicillium egyptiacum TaxID=1303716 RepID=A0A9W4KPU9_9EURO|nr:unnamed protein product [Penicillium egyptiacum]